MPKINWKNIILNSHWLLIIGLLSYTRFINLGWGLPYPMHPDERNMIMAIENFNCRLPPVSFQWLKIKECFNPHFFAYGQFTLFLAYLLVIFLKFWDGDLNTPVAFSEAAISLRIISAFFSILNFFVILKIIKLVDPKIKKIDFILACFLVIFSPFFIQFAHFGTTESLLMFLYTAILYLSLKFIQIKRNPTSLKTKLIFITGILSGIAIAVKVSSLIFIVPSLLVFFYKHFLENKKNFLIFLKKLFYDLFIFCIPLILISLFFSPYNWLALNEFLGSFNYESGVALGRIKVFYTKQFENSIPILFQLIKIFPYALGWINYLSWFGFIFLSWKNKEINLLRIYFLSYFLPTAFLYTKWSRFMAPVMPILLIFGILAIYWFKDSSFKILIRFLNKRKKNNKLKILPFYYLLFTIYYIVLLLPGVAYLSIYKNLDIRFQASLWMINNIRSGSFILSETANVVDIPYVLPPKSRFNVPDYSFVSFNFYDIDDNSELSKVLIEYLNKANYIIIPSRRIFLNYYCLDKKVFNFVYYQNHCQYLKETFPLLNQYYSQLLSGNLGFVLIKKFSSYPKIEFFGKKIIEFNDEMAEETWTVFDHPVIRVYKKYLSSNF